MKNKIIPYNPALKAHARAFRKNSTLSEMALWHTIKNRSLGVQFHRQVPLLDFIVDFYSPEIQLAVEIHEHVHEYYYDKDQQKGILEAHGVTFLNFSDLDINQNIDAVEIALKEKINILLGVENELKKETSLPVADKPSIGFNNVPETKLNPETEQADFSFPKKEKLKSKKIFEELFTEGKNISSYPLKLIYVKSALIGEVPIQAGVTVSKKKFKSAVARNRIKRLLRESYRLNKHIVFNNIEGNFAFLFLYIGSEMPSQQMVSDQMIKLLHLFVKKTQ